MDTEQQQLMKLVGAFWNQAPLAQVDPLATPSVLLIADAEGKPPLWLALEHHNDPKVIKLVIRRLPEALLSVVYDRCIIRCYKNLPAKNRISNHGKIGRLLVDCINAYRQHRFPRLIELCGTSDALEALVVAFSEKTCRCACSACVGRGTRCSRASSSFPPRLQSLSSSSLTSLVTLRFMSRPATRRLWRC